MKPYVQETKLSKVVKKLQYSAWDIENWTTEVSLPLVGIAIVFLGGLFAIAYLI